MFEIKKLAFENIRILLWTVAKLWSRGQFWNKTTQSCVLRSLIKPEVSILNVFLVYDPLINKFHHKAGFLSKKRISGYFGTSWDILLNLWCYRKPTVFTKYSLTRILFDFLNIFGTAPFSWILPLKISQNYC